MTWQGVPWAVGAHPGGSPETPAEAARALAHQALGGLEGPAGPGDVAVVPLDVPGGAVVVRKGTIGITNRFPGGQGQSYIARNVDDDQVAITATGSGGGRTDLIAVVIEDPQYAGQPVPPDAANGPYVRTVVYEGVSANVESLEEVDADQSGYALARVTLPASTGTVETAHITDLRELPRARSKTVKRTLDVGDKGSWDVINGAGFERFPQAAAWNIKVPLWATVAQLEMRVTGVRVTNDGTDAGTWRGRARLKLGSHATTETIIDPEIPNANKGNRFAYNATGEVSLTAAQRGTTLTLEAQAIRQNFTSGVEVREAAGTTVVCEVRFIEAPNTDAPETFL